MLQAGQGDSQCGGEDRGRGVVGRDEAVGQPEPGCMGPLQAAGRTLATALCVAV